MKSISVSEVHQEAKTYDDPTALQNAPLHDNSFNKHQNVCQKYQEVTHMLNIAAAEEVLPRSRNHGLKPSEDLARMIRMC